MKAIGVIKITDELTLKDPTMDIINVSYNWITNIVSIEIYFKEGGSMFNHSRVFNYNNSNGEIKTDLDIINYINNDPILKVFK